MSPQSLKLGVSLQFAGRSVCWRKAPIYPEALFWQNVNSLRQKSDSQGDLCGADRPSKGENAKMPTHGVRPGLSSRTITAYYSEASKKENVKDFFGSLQIIGEKRKGIWVPVRAVFEDCVATKFE